MASSSVPGGTTSSESRICLIALSFSARSLLSESLFARILSRSMSLLLFELSITSKYPITIYFSQKLHLQSHKCIYNNVMDV